MSNIGLTTYISYRNTESWELAKLIKKYFDKEKFACLINENKKLKLNEENFNLYEKTYLSKADIFLVIISRKSLQACKNRENDWFFKEIEYAINHNKMIIPLVDDTTFTIPKGLPPILNELNHFNAVYVNEKNLANAMANIFKFIINEEYKILINADRNENKRFDNPLFKNNKYDSFQLIEKVDPQLPIDESEGFYFWNLFELAGSSQAREINGNAILLIDWDFGYLQSLKQKMLKSLYLHGQEPYLNILLITIAINPKYKNMERESYRPSDSLSFNYYVDFFADDWKKQVEPILTFARNFTKNRFATDIKGEFKFDCVICRNILKNFKNPIEFLKKVKTFLHVPKKYWPREIINKIKENYEKDCTNPYDLQVPFKNLIDFIDDNFTIYSSQLTIMEQDQDFEIISSENQQLFNQFNNLINQCPIFGNRKTGKYVEYYLKEAGFDNINILSVSRSDQYKDFNFSTNSYSRPTKKIFSLESKCKYFEQLYTNLKNAYETLLKNSPYNKQYYQACYWLENNHDKLMEEIKKDSFFFSDGSIMWSAYPVEK